MFSGNPPPLTQEANGSLRAGPRHCWLPQTTIRESVPQSGDDLSPQAIMSHWNVYVFHSLQSKHMYGFLNEACESLFKRGTLAQRGGPIKC